MLEIDHIYNEDCLEGMKRIDDNSIDLVLTDPPYLYLKNQKLDRPFDEKAFFSEVKRVLKKDGFIVCFGRGTSFYRWNTILADMGFTFKEEIIWDKGYTSSPLMKIARVHETCSISTKGNGSINKVKIPYIEMKQFDLASMQSDINRLMTTYQNPKSMQAVKEFIENNKLTIDKSMKPRMGVTCVHETGDADGAAKIFSVMSNGLREKTIIRSDRRYSDKFTKYGINSDKRKTGDRPTNIAQSMSYGMNEKSIINETPLRKQAIHPTEKPVRLLERLMLLTSKEGDLVLDPFRGSASTAVACINQQRHFIGFEIDKEYFDVSIERLKTITPRIF